MKENVGRIDRIGRTAIGGSLVLLGMGALIRGSRVSALLKLMGGAMLLESAITRVCPISSALGIDTRSKQERMEDFRTEVDGETERIEHDYGRPLDIGDEPSRDTLSP